MDQPSFSGFVAYGLLPRRPMKTLPIFFLKGLARRKPEGFYETALTYGTVEGQVLRLTDEQWEALQPQLAIYDAHPINRGIKEPPKRDRGLGDVVEAMAKPVA